MSIFHSREGLNLANRTREQNTDELDKAEVPASTSRRERTGLASYRGFRSSLCNCLWRRSFPCSDTRTRCGDGLTSLSSDSYSRTHGNPSSGSYCRTNCDPGAGSYCRTNTNPGPGSYCRTNSHPGPGSHCHTNTNSSPGSHCRTNSPGGSIAYSHLSSGPDTRACRTGRRRPNAGIRRSGNRVLRIERTGLHCRLLQV